MQLRFEIPEGFWSLFRSVNRETYIEALMAINEEYQYSNYFLTREVCIQVLRDLYMKKQIELKREEDETEFDMLETPSARILNWLIRKGWLKKIEDYNTLVTNIVIPDYAAIFVDAFERLSTEDLEETEIYIQNVFATLFSFKNDPRVNLNMLRTALINTRRLNKALQDMLHNMDKFFARLLEQQFYGDLLKEHLDGYVEEIVRKKYHILKTSDNFYIYKTDIKECLRQMRDDEEWIEKIRERVPASFPVTCRIHLFDGEGYEGENTVEDMIEIAKYLESKGVDGFNTTIGSVDRTGSPEMKAGWRNEYYKQFKAALNVPIYGPNEVKTPEEAEQFLAEGVYDFQILGRQQSADPEWANKAKAGRSEDIRPCISCNYCLYRVTAEDAQIRCAVNPLLGREIDNLAPLKHGEGTVIIIGAGPAGIQAAFTLTERGFKVKLYDKREDMAKRDVQREIDRALKERNR